MAVASTEDELAARFGQADVSVHPVTEGRDISSAVLDQALAEGGGRYVVVHRVGVRTTDRFDSVFLADPDLRDPIHAGRFTLVSGKAPLAAGEIAIDRWFVEHRNLGIGDTIRFEEIEEPFTVVGIAVRNEATHDQFAFVQPGLIDDNAGYYVDVGTTTAADLRSALAQAGYPQRPDDIPGANVEPLGEGVVSEVEIVERADRAAPSAKRDAVSAGVFAGGVVIAGLCALVASAAFAMSIRRRQRELGLLATVGASPRQLRQVVVLEGTVVGVVASLAGVAGGLALVAGARPRIEAAAHRLVGPLQMDVRVMVGAVTLGVVASAFAAWLPARGMANQSPIESLQARRPAPPMRGRTGIVGVALSAVGLGLVTVGSVSSIVAIVVGGAFAAFAGALLAAPFLVERLARFADRAPITPRIGVRDIARNRGRSAALLAAVLAIVAIPVGIAAAVESENAHTVRAHSPAMGDNHVLLAALPDERERLGEQGDVESTARIFSRTLDGVEAHGAIRALNTTGPTGIEASGGTWRQRRPYPESSIANDPFWGRLAVVDHGALEALEISDLADELEAGTVIGVGPGTATGGEVTIRDTTETMGTHRALESDAVSGYELPTHLVSADRADELGLQVGNVQAWLFRLDHPPTTDEIENLRTIAARAGLHVSAESGRLQPPVVSTWVIVAITGSLATLVVAIIAGLAAAENRRDRRVLVAVGATPTTARTAAATGATIIVAIAAGIGATLSTGLIAAYQYGRGPAWPGGPTYPPATPWTAIGFAVIALPSASYLIAWIANRPPSQGLGHSEA